MMSRKSGETPFWQAAHYGVWTDWLKARLLARTFST